MAADPQRLGSRWRIAVLVKSVPQGLDPINEVALEWALRQRADGRAASVTAVTMGPPGAVEGLRRALAFGADDALLVTDPALAGSDVRRTARVLAAAVGHVGAVVAVFGYESSDGSSGVVPAAVATVLGWPVLSRVSDAQWNDSDRSDGDTIDVDRDAGHGAERVRVGVPVVLTFVEGRVAPRYPAMRDVLRARRAPVQQIDHRGLGLDDVESVHHERVLSTSPVELSSRQPRFVAEGDGADAILALLAEAGAVR